MKAILPIYLLAGGRGAKKESPDPILQMALRELGKTKPSVAYIGAAHGDTLTFFLFIKRLITAAGAGKVELVPLVKKKSNMEKVQSIIESADCIFVSGGDVSEGMRILTDRSVILLIKKRYNEGALIIGVSAGSIMLAKQWINWPDENDEASAELFPCMNIAPVLCDTHGEEDKWDELHSLVGLTEDDQIGYGIPSGGAMRISSDGTVEAIRMPLYRIERKGDKIAQINDLAVTD
jgi:cyanophycinase-like exopeptidase